MLAEGSLPVRRHALWLLALLASAEGDVTGAQRWLRSSFAPDGGPILPRFPMDVADEVDLARMGLAAGDDELVRLAVAGSDGRAALNPGVASVEATAAHVRGLVHDDLAELEQAVALLERGTRRLELASALEDLGTRLERGGAVDVLGRALELYTEVGAGWDARRVRGRLREATDTVGRAIEIAVALCRQDPEQPSYGRTLARARLVQDKKADHRCSSLGGGVQRGMVGQPQVVAKPDDDRRGGWVGHPGRQLESRS